MNYLLDVLPLLAAASALETFIKDNAVTSVLIGLTIVAGIAAFVFRAKLLPAGSLSPTSAAALTETEFRHLVAKSVLFSAIWGTVVVAGLAVFSSNAQTVLSIVLPVFGTWIGTLLAYYFGKDNFEAGARSSVNAAKQLSGMEKLEAIPVTKPGIMIPLDKIEIPDLIKGKPIAEFANINLQALRDVLNRERLPLIDPANGSVVAVLHRSLLNDFLLTRSVADRNNLGSTTLQHLLDDPVAGKTAKNTFVVLPNTVTLAVVKERMNQQTQRAAGKTCEDAFITAPGSAKIEGWITNDIIAEHALPVVADGNKA